MSGFEVAGLVLGAIPLVISALEHYEEGVGVMKNMMQYECVFSDISISFAASVAIFSNSCFQLLNPLNLPDQRLSELLIDRKPNAWSDEQLHQELKQRLGTNCKIYLSLIDKLNKRIMLFCKKLKLDDKLRPPWIKTDGAVDEKARKKFFGNAWIRIKGGFDSSKYAGLLQSIDNDIAKIAQLTAGDAKLEPIRAERQSRMRSKQWKNVRDQAQNLFENLSSKLSPCSCHCPHSAQLRLQPQYIDEREDEDFHDDDAKIHFSILLTFDKSSCTLGSPPWDCRSIFIEASALEDTLQLKGSSKTQEKLSVSLPSVTITPSSIQTTKKDKVSSSTSDEIKDLCKMLLTSPQSEQYLGFLESQASKHLVYREPSSQQFSDVSRLQDLMNTNQLRISTVEKCALALTLASAVLQLWETPWLPTTWTSKDIVMLNTSSGLTVPSHFYVSKNFDVDTSSSTLVPARSRRFVKNEMVFALGVALLELSYSRSLIDFKVAEDLNEQGLEDSMTEVSIATRLADTIHEREMENYAKAVLRCVRCSFDTFSCDFDDADFRKNFYTSVVAPLQADYEYTTSKRP